MLGFAFDDNRRRNGQYDIQRMIPCSRKFQSVRTAAYLWMGDSQLHSIVRVAWNAPSFEFDCSSILLLQKPASPDTHWFAFLAR